MFVECSNPNCKKVIYKRPSHVARSRDVSCSLRCRSVMKKKHIIEERSTSRVGGRVAIRNEEGVFVPEHRYVMEKKLGRPLESWEIVHHKDEDKTNNDPDNLEVMSDSEHMKTHRTWEKSNNQILDNSQVYEILDAIHSGKTRIEVAKQFKMSPQQISSIALGQSRKDIFANWRKDHGFDATTS